MSETDLTDSNGLDSGTGQNPVTQESTTPAIDRQSTQDAKPINWQESPEFKEWQRKNDTRYETTRKQLQEFQTRTQQYEQMLEQLQTRDMDDIGKERFARAKLERQLQQMQQLQAEQEGRNRVFSRIADTAKSAGVDIKPDLLQEAQDADHAWEIAFKHLIANLPKQAAVLAEKKQNNSVDLGGALPGNDLTAQLDEAFAQGDVRKYMRLVRESKKK